MAITWKSKTRVEIDPDARLDYTHDLTDWLQGDTVTDVTFLVDGPAITELISNDGSIIHFWVRDVTATSEITLRVLTAQGREDDFTYSFRSKEQ